MKRSLLQPHDVLLVVGKRGTGKSTEAKAVLEHAIKARQRCVVFDYHDEYSRRGSGSSQVRLGACRERITADELFRRPAVLDSDSLSLAVVPSQDPAEAALDFAGWVDLVLATGDLLAMADEVGVYGSRVQAELDRLACQSRHSAVPLVLVAQRMVQIPKTARTQATLLASFRQDDPDDLKALASLVGAEGKPFAVRVSRLKRGECERWRDDLSASPTTEKPTP